MSNAYNARPFVLAIPPRFSSFAEARQPLDESMRWMFYSVNNPDQSSVPKIRAMLEQTLEEWLWASSHLLMCTETEPDPQDLRAGHIMRIYCHVSFIIIDAYLSGDEMVYDRHITGFREIIGMSQEILSMDTGADGQHTLSFSFDFGVTPPPYFTASHCRNPLIRRRALELLRYSHRKQGSWNSEHTAKYAEEIIKIEETGLGLVQISKDVPKESCWPRKDANLVRTYHISDLALNSTIIQRLLCHLRAHSPEAVFSDGYRPSEAFRADMAGLYS